MITIIDYQMGNLGSIVNTFKRLSIPVSITSNSNEIETADKLILPGVGSFDRGMENLTRMNLVNSIRRGVLENGSMILGICLGMQLFFSESMEGEKKGIGLLEGGIVRFDRSRIPVRYKIPHMGWNTLKINTDHRIFANISDRDRFYFAHSYHADQIHPDDTGATSEYGYEFPAVVIRDNIIGIQFHPERSHQAGLQILRNFSVI